MGFHFGFVWFLERGFRAFSLPQRGRGQSALSYCGCGKARFIVELGPLKGVPFEGLFFALFGKGIVIRKQPFLFGVPFWFCLVFGKKVLVRLW